MILIKSFADSSMTPTHSPCSGSRRVSRSRLTIPRTPFIGVRSSWLMLARNSDFERDASSACPTAVRRASVRWSTFSSNSSRALASDWFANQSSDAFDSSRLSASWRARRSLSRREIQTSSLVAIWLS